MKVVYFFKVCGLIILSFLLLSNNIVLCERLITELTDIA
jgi:hypothetical protein